MLKNRASGILCHITSLPSPFGIGDLGPEAHKFVDFLSRTKQHYWQLLPLNPTETIYGNSPYSSFSAFASNPILISPQQMVHEGWLSAKDIKEKPKGSQNAVDYPEITKYKSHLFDIAYENFSSGKKDRKGFLEFCQRNEFWLEDFASFVVFKEKFSGHMWGQWPSEIRDRHSESLQKLNEQLKEKKEKVKFLQYIFCKQWFSLKSYCNKKGVKLIGDIPIYVNYDSSDVWAHQELFELDSERMPTYVAGVPPDYFSETGQRWGNPVYRWEKLKETGYKWWIQRFQNNFNLFDLVRIDHFRGFVAYWQIPASEQTAINGKWVAVPTDDFLNKMFKVFPDFSIIAEDLGLITPDVTEAMEKFGFPGMKVLLFAFGGETATHPYIPENYKENCVVYTGTHDNNTAVGWLDQDASDEEKENLKNYLGREVTPRQLPSELIRLAMTSCANTAIFPMQDLLGLGSEARMNTPATTEGNWQWRFQMKSLTLSLEKKLLELTRDSNRTVKG